MSVNISISSNKNKQNVCEDILETLKKLNINCRTIQTISNVDKELEYGCLITIGKQYNSKKKVGEIWQTINKKNKYGCSHLKIDGLFDGCINNYINANYCSD